MSRMVVFHPDIGADQEELANLESLNLLVGTMWQVLLEEITSRRVAS